jgi:hypothetical protein
VFWLAAVLIPAWFYGWAKTAHFYLGLFPI